MLAVLVYRSELHNVGDHPRINVSIDTGGQDESRHRSLLHGQKEKRSKEQEGHRPFNQRIETATSNCSLSISLFVLL